MKFFNTAGPCKPDIHYMLPASTRLPELLRLIDQKMYFVIHAPRQVGKTTMMLQLAQELTRVNAQRRNPLGLRQAGRSLSSAANDTGTI